VSEQARPGVRFGLWQAETLMKPATYSPTL
jgi:hypothetical protein